MALIVPTRSAAEALAAANLPSGAALVAPFQVTQAVDLKTTGAVDILTVPAGHAVALDSIELVTRAITGADPENGPVVSVGTTANPAEFADAVTLVTTADNVRHVLGNPQDEVDGPTTVRLTVGTASGATTHSAAVVLRGSLRRL